MRKGFLLFFTLLLGVSPAWGADFDKGLAAAQAGDYATALREWKPLADQGNVAAQFSLGVMYENGHGVPQDYKEAVRLYRLAAAQGYASAQYNLGGMYYNGRGVPQDYKEAVKWYRLAADQGNALAQGYLGAMYVTGDGVPKDAPTAYMWLNIAAASGDKKAEDLRDKLARTMTPSQIEKGQDMTRACIAKNYKGC